jgi:DNA-directed RNA polymerase subunit RPC12/RpoP
MSNKTLNFLRSMTAISLGQKNYAEAETKEVAAAEAKTCPNCGAPRAKQDGLTRCAYCGFKFMDTRLSNGIYLTEEDNSKNV